MKTEEVYTINLGDYLFQWHGGRFVSVYRDMDFIETIEFTITPSTYQVNALAATYIRG